MTALAVATRQVAYEHRTFWRNPAAAVFTCGFPIMFLVVFATVNGNNHVAELGGVRFAQFYTPSIIAFGLIGACFTNLAINTCFKRDYGTLKRVRGTPVSPTAYLAGVVLASITIAMILAALTIGIGVLFYGVHIFASRLPALSISLALGAAAFCALALAITSVIPNAESAAPITNGIVLPLAFASGVFVPVKSNSVLGTLSTVLPLRHLVEAVYAAFDPTTTGTGLGVAHYVLLVVWTAVGVVVARTQFRWEPRK